MQTAPMRPSSRDPDEHTELLRSMYQSPAAIEQQLSYAAHVESKHRQARFGHHVHTASALFNSSSSRSAAQAAADASAYAAESQLFGSSSGSSRHRSRKRAPAFMLNTDRRAKEREPEADALQDEFEVLLPDQFVHPESRLHIFIRPDTILDVEQRRAERAAEKRKILQAQLTEQEWKELLEEDEEEKRWNEEQKAAEEAAAAAAARSRLPALKESSQQQQRVRNSNGSSAASTRPQSRSEHVRTPHPPKPVQRSLIPQPTPPASSGGNSARNQTPAPYLAGSSALTPSAILAQFQPSAPSTPSQLPGQLPFRASDFYSSPMRPAAVASTPTPSSARKPQKIEEECKTQSRPASAVAATATPIDSALLDHTRDLIQQVKDLQSQLDQERTRNKQLSERLAATAAAAPTNPPNSETAVVVPSPACDASLPPTHSRRPSALSSSDDAVDAVQRSLNRQSLALKTARRSLTEEKVKVMQDALAVAKEKETVQRERDAAEAAAATANAAAANSPISPTPASPADAEAAEATKRASLQQLAVLKAKRNSFNAERDAAAQAALAQQAALAEAKAKHEAELAQQKHQHDHELERERREHTQQLEQERRQHQELLERERQEHQQSLQAQKAQMEKDRSELAADRAQIAKLREEATAMAASHGAELVSLRAEVAAQRDAQSKEIARLETLVSELQAQNAKHAQERSQLDAERTMLAERQAAVDRRLSELEAASSLIGEQQQNLAQERDEWVAEQSEARATLNAELAASRAEHDAKLRSEALASLNAQSVSLAQAHERSQLLWHTERAQLESLFKQACEEERQKLALEHHFFVQAERATFKAASQQLERERRAFEEQRRRFFTQQEMQQMHAYPPPSNNATPTKDGPGDASGAAPAGPPRPFMRQSSHARNSTMFTSPTSHPSPRSASVAATREEQVEQHQHAVRSTLASLQVAVHSEHAGLRPAGAPASPLIEEGTQ